MPDTLHPAARAHLATWFDQAWTEGLWAAAWSKSLDGLTPEQAAWSPGPHTHSIWQQVLHMVYWRERHIRRIETGRPPSNDDLAALNWPEITDISEGAWAAARARFEATQRRIAALLGESDPAHDVLVYFLPHDCYHFGQINSARAMLGFKPIE
ncbi:MAG: DinB family protein [Phycisphaerales bacterium]|nr:DinB family protein [Phycisphaerales bacterium]